jgi:hypothetical protein
LYEKGLDTSFTEDQLIEAATKLGVAEEEMTDFFEELASWTSDPEAREETRENPAFEPSLAQWQKDYDSAVGKGGTVESVYADVDRMGGIAIYVEVDEEGETVRYSPFYDQSPSEENLELAEDDPDAYISMMEGAADWDEWEWVEE